MFPIRPAAAQGAAVLAAPAGPVSLTGRPVSPSPYTAAGCVS
jgi:hypothetical protein